MEEQIRKIVKEEVKAQKTITVELEDVEDNIDDAVHKEISKFIREIVKSFDKKYIKDLFIQHIFEESDFFCEITREIADKLESQIEVNVDFKINNKEEK